MVSWMQEVNSGSHMHQEDVFPAEDTQMSDTLFIETMLLQQAQQGGSWPRLFS